METIVNTIEGVSALVGSVLIVGGAGTVDYAAEVGRATDWRPFIVGAACLFVAGCIMYFKIALEDED